ncbi:MAG: DUF3828 domain-containing protein [Burkholderiales bacterium]|nr:MAG: DUF3828 domain-containing protein [Burkholderiales bacterium]
MIKPSRLAVGCLQVAVVAIGLSGAAYGKDSEGFESALPEAKWRMTRSLRAPWTVEGQGHSASAPLKGKLLRFSARGVDGPHPLACTQLQHEFVLSPAEGLFQGALPEPADSHVRTFGVRELPVLTLRVNCESGSFDYHLLSARRALLGFDNRIWRLQREDKANTAEDVVLAFLQRHMSGEMAFTSASVARKSHLLSPNLARAISTHFAHHQPADEAPKINGDPFTNSQEYPERFVLGRARLDQRKAVVPVRFGGVERVWVVRFVLRRSMMRWRVDDLIYEDDAALRPLLAVKER